mmetsp:Transcript_32458/g.66222  ORF Transcript_32458/g.66222 Transcript_32458/m.66222 type:complete len:209 (-) Transcript_32458:534-1160(-)
MLIEHLRLEIAVAGVAGKRDGVSDVLHARHEHHETLEAEAEPGVRASAVLSKVQVPRELLLAYAHFVRSAQKRRVVILSRRSSDDLSDAGHENIHRLHRLPPRRSALVEFHVEGFDGFRVVGADDGAFEHAFREVPLVLGGHVHAPLNVFVLKRRRQALGHVLLQGFDGFRVGHPRERFGQELFQASHEVAVPILHRLQHEEVVHALG